MSVSGSRRCPCAKPGVAPQSSLTSRSVLHLEGFELPSPALRPPAAIAPHGPRAHLELTPPPAGGPASHLHGLASPTQVATLLGQVLPLPCSPVFCPRLTLLILFSPGLWLGVRRTASYCSQVHQGSDASAHVEFPQG